MADEDRTAVRVRVTGEVQGVAFRHHTVEQARSLGVTGWVRNEVDGSVVAHAEGPEDRVRQLVDWCRTGPPAARVAGVEVDPADPESPSGFDVRG